MKDSYTLRANRYGEKHILTKDRNKNLFLLNATEYLRVGYENDGSINFIDPPGGPFICKDTVLYCDDAILVVNGLKEDGKDILIDISEYSENK